MFKFVAASLLALAGLVAAQTPAADPSINSPPSLVQCQPVQLTWTATNEPVFISVIPGGQPGAMALHDFGQQARGTKSLTWVVDMPAGSSVTLQIRDFAGAVAYSGNMNIQDSSDSSCVDPNQTPIPAPGPTSAASSAAQSPSRSPDTPATSAAATTPAGTSPAAASSTRAPAAATSATPSSGSAAASNAALPGAQIGWTGLMGVLAAFIVA